MNASLDTPIDPLVSLQWCYDRLSHIHHIHTRPDSVEAGFGLSETMEELAKGLPEIREAHNLRNSP